MLSIAAVVPAYNAEKWIGRAIESVLNQTARPAEIVVVDDGSTDDTARVVGEYGAAVRYVYQHNSGPAVARNKGISEATAEWIAFLDADDEWLPHKIESQMRVLEKHRDIMWCTTAFEDTDGEDTLPSLLPEELKQQLDRHGSLPYFMASIKGMRIGTPGFIIHRSVLNEVGGFDPEMPAGQDMDMWCRIALKYPRIGYCSDPCWRHHKDNPDSVTERARSCRDRQLKSLCKNMRSAMELGPAVVNDFRPYAKKKVMDNLLRLPGRMCVVESDTLDDVRLLFPPSLRERAVLTILSLLPLPIARWVAEWLRG